MPGRQDWFLNEVTSSFRLGTFRDATPCNVAPDKRHSTRPTDVCFPNSRLRAPVLAGSRCVHDAYASCGAVGFGAHRVAGGGDVHSVRSPLRRIAFASVRGLQPRAGVLSPARPMRSTSDVHVASLASGFRRTCGHAFAWVLPGESRQGSVRHRLVKGDDFARTADAFHRQGPFRVSRTCVPPRSRCPPCRESFERRTLMRGGCTNTGLDENSGWSRPRIDLSSRDA